MKVIQVVPQMQEGGVERGVVELAQKFVENGDEFIVISHGGKLEKNLKHIGAKHINFDVCSKSLISFIPRVLKFRKLIKQLNPDIIHVRSRVPAWIVFFANYGLNFNVVSTVHGLNSVGFLLRHYSKILTKFKAVICVSNCVKEYIIKHFDVSEKKIFVIFRGVNLEQFNPNLYPNKATLKKKYHLKDDVVISCIGRISQTKDLETFIRAIAVLKLNFKNIQGLIVGGVNPKKQKYYKQLKELIKSLQIEDNIIFTGSISNIGEIYKVSDCVVSSSIKPESFGRTLAEAIAMNIPVVATRHGGVLDIINEGKNGYFFTPREYNELSKMILKAIKLKFNGYDYIRDKFNLEKMFKQTIEVYKSLKDG